MTHSEKRINIILTNYAKGKYDLAYLKNILARGLRHVEERGVMGVDRRFIENLAHIEAAIKRIEHGQSKQKGNQQ
jgi:hypothetical protein